MNLVNALVMTLSTLIFSFNTHALTKVKGAGASFPYPIYSKWFSEYEKTNKDVQFNYQAIGSGGGIRQLIKQTVDFGASDAPVQSHDKKQAKWPLKHIPTVIGALTVAYNLPGIEELRLDGEVIAKIFLAQITNWNHPLIQKLNPQVKLPDTKILAIGRADASGSTYIFSDYLTAASKTWKSNMKIAKALPWSKKTVQAKGNDGVTSLIKKTQGAIGYIELAYALKNDLKTAHIKNKSDKFIAPTIKSISAAASSIDGGDESALTRSIVHATGDQAYPICSFTYMLLPVKQKKDAKLEQVKKFLTWALSEGQRYAPQLHYAPLPEKFRSKLIKSLK